MMDKAGQAAAVAAALWSGAAAAQETRAQAMAEIAATLPKATAANPSYLTKADGALTQWLTDEVGFETAADGAVTVTMREHYLQTQAGKTVEARHVARFAMADVTVAPHVDPGDVTPSGEPATGIVFACKTKGCIAAQWGDAASPADTTDVSIQDLATRDKMLAAFRRLQTP